MRLVLLVAAAAFLVLGWKTLDRRSMDREFSRLAARNPSGFVSVVMPSGWDPNTVWVLAPANCPSDAALRAEHLVLALKSEGIPAARASSLTVQTDNKDEATAQALQRLERILKGTVPAVLVNGMGKANPTADEVIREFRRQKPS